MSETNVKYIKVATGSSQANGQVERYNRIVTPALGKLYTGKDWHKSLDEIKFVINNTVNRTTGKTLSELLYGVRQRGYVVDALKEFILDQDDARPEEIGEVRGKAAKKIEKARKINEDYVNVKRKTAREYAEGDLVVIKNFETTGGKLVPSYRGPYQVIRRLKNNRYVLADIEGCQISQRPYKGTWEATNMKPWRNSPEQEQDNWLDLELESERDENE